jgi:phosphoesterase RecJ-like protein
LTRDKEKKDISREIAKIILENDNFLLLTHVFPDGDAIGSLTAFHKLLKSLGKNSTMICKSDLPYQYKFLPGFSEIKKEDAISGTGGKKHIFIVLDCGDGGRTGLNLKELKNKGCLIINIDHHRSNDLFGEINMIDSEKSATSEMLFEFIFKHFPDKLDYDIAMGIYVGILTDTGKFQYSNTTANVHRITGNLLEYGILPSKVYGHIYESDPLGRFKLIQTVFDRIKYIESLGLIYSYVLENDFEKLDIPVYAQDGIIDLLRSAEGASITALIKEIGRNSYKVSLRTSERDIDLSRLAAGFGGGGHRSAAAYKDKGELNKVISNLKSAIGKETDR